jgi:multicomponent K+:H+ antiporter subunit D
MTKVGAYAIIRVHTMVFGPDVAVTDGLTATWLMPAAVVTLAVGAVGVLGARRLMPLLSFAVVGSMGTMMIAVAAFTPYAMTSALYYLVHSTFSAAALFLLADLVVSRRKAGDLLRPEPPTVQNGLFAALFFAGAIGMAGMPPLSGFLGKLMILDAMKTTPEMVTAWAAILVGSLVTIVGFARAGSILFWKATAMAPEASDAEGEEQAGADPATRPAGEFATRPAGAMEVAPTVLALAMLAVLAAGAGPVTGYLEAASGQLFDPAGYVSAVLGDQGEAGQ